MGGLRQIGFRATDELIARIDDAAGDVPRERWLRRVIEEHLAGNGPALERLADAARELDRLLSQPVRHDGGGVRQRHEDGPPSTLDSDFVSDEVESALLMLHDCLIDLRALAGGAT